MNGPRILCAGCGAPTGFYEPFCRDCAAFFVSECGQMPFCVLCHQGLPVEHGMHKTPTGGHAGRCTITSCEQQP
jgi:predicted amidophosphoribosyltransferase